MTALTRTVTLSFVITSCAGMSIVTMRRSTLHHPLDVGDEQDDARPARPDEAAEPEDDAALVLLHDLDRGEERHDDDDDDRDDDGERCLIHGVLLGDDVS